MSSAILWLPLIKRVFPFSNLIDIEIEKFSSEILIRDYSPNSIIQHHESVENSHLYLLLSGHVKLTESMEKDRTHILGEGKFFGHYSLLRNSPLPFQVETQDEVKLALFPASVFKMLCSQHPRIAAFFESDIRIYTRSKLILHDLSGSQFLFGTRLGDLISRQSPQCQLKTTVQQAAVIMEEHSTDHIVVVDDSNKPIGLVTDSLLRDRIIAVGCSYEMPVEQIMDSNPIFLSHRNNLFEALLLMTQKNISHILIKQATTNKHFGVIGSSDITRGQGYNPLLVLNQINSSSKLDQLIDLRHEADSLLGQLYNRGVKAQSLITINTVINDAITGKVLELSKTALVDANPQVNIKWVWLSLGSEGRGEMSLKTDQDNALIYDVLDQDEHLVDRWLSIWTKHVNQSLSEVGLNLCEGNMMASNPHWRIRIQDWNQHVNAWLKQSQAMQIMQTSAACDLRAVHGDVEMEKTIKNEMSAAIKVNYRFLKHMVSAVISNRPPVNAFTGRIRTLKTDEGKKIDLKRNGIQPITEFARILCLQAGYFDSSNTFDRLEYLKQMQPQIQDSISEALVSYNHLNDIRLGHHLQAISMGKKPDNLIAINELSDTQYQMLKAAFSSIKSIQATLAHRFNLM